MSYISLSPKPREERLSFPPPRKGGVEVSQNPASRRKARIPRPSVDNLFRDVLTPGSIENNANDKTNNHDSKENNPHNTKNNSENKKFIQVNMIHIQVNKEFILGNMIHIQVNKEFILGNMIHIQVNKKFIRVNMIHIQVNKKFIQVNKIHIHLNKKFIHGNKRHTPALKTLSPGSMFGNHPFRMVTPASIFPVQAKTVEKSQSQQKRSLPSRLISARMESPHHRHSIVYQRSSQQGTSTTKNPGLSPDPLPGIFARLVRNVFWSVLLR